MLDKLTPLLQHRYAIPVLVGTSAFGVGAGLGFVLGRRPPSVEEGQEEIHTDPNQLTLSFSDQIQAERLSWDLDEDFSDWPIDAEYLVDYYTEDELDDDAELGLEEDEDETGDPIIENVFAHGDSEWDYEAEKSTRSDKDPYIIHLDEFVSSESGFDQSTIVYYEGDDILADEFDTPMYDWPNLLGDLTWGHGSNDANVVYIRNERLTLEWEVLRHTGRFQEEVLGLSVEQEYSATDQLKHSKHSPRFDHTVP